MAQVITYVIRLSTSFMPRDEPRVDIGAGVRSRASLQRLACNGHPQQETAMTAEAKSPLDQVNDALNQLKEMRHYSKNYVEQLTTQWLLFDGPLKKLRQAGKFEDLMTRQAEFHESLDTEIGELEALAAELQPPPEEQAAA